MHTSQPTRASAAFMVSQPSSASNSFSLFRRTFTIRRGCCSPPRRSTMVPPGCRVWDARLYKRTRNSPRMPCVVTIVPSATRASIAAARAAPSGLLFLNDFEDDLAIGTRGRRVEDGADGFRGAALLANDAPKVLFGHLEFQHGGRIALGLLHFDGIRVIDQRAGKELYQFLHGVCASPGSGAATGDCSWMPLFLMSCATVALGRAPRLSQCAS